MRTSVPAWSLLAALTLATTAANAQSPATTPATPPVATTPPTAAPGRADVDLEVEARRQRAREHFQRGVELIEQGRWLDAISELQQAREIRVTAPVMYNLGLAQRAVGRNHDAILSFREFLRLAGPNGNPELVARVQGYTRELAAGFGRMELRIEPATASVSIDGVPTVVGTEPLDVDPGRHVVSVTATGFASETRAIEVRRGGAAVVVLRMVPNALAAHLRIESNLPEALIRIDGNDVGFGTADESLRPGRHAIEVRAPGRSTFRREFDAVAGTETTVRAVLTDQRTVFVSPWFWTGTGAVIATAVILGIVLGSSLEPAYRGSWGTVTEAITVGGGR